MSVISFSGRNSREPGGGLQALADQGLVGGGLDADPFEHGLRGALVVEDQLGAAQGQLVALAEQVLADPLAAEEGAVEAAEIAVEEGAAGLADDLGMFLRHDPVEDLHHVVGVTADGRHGAELDLPPTIAPEHHELGHPPLQSNTPERPGYPAPVRRGGFFGRLPLDPGGVGLHPRA